MLPRKASCFGLIPKVVAVPISWHHHHHPLRLEGCSSVHVHTMRAVHTYTLTGSTHHNRLDNTSNPLSSVARGTEGNPCWAFYGMLFPSTPRAGRYPASSAGGPNLIVYQKDDQKTPDGRGISCLPSGFAEFREVQGKLHHAAQVAATHAAHTRQQRLSQSAVLVFAGQVTMHWWWIIRPAIEAARTADSRTGHFADPRRYPAQRSCCWPLRLLRCNRGYRRRL